MSNVSATMAPTAHTEAKPKLDRKMHPATGIIFIGLLAAGVLLTAYGLYADVSGRLLQEEIAAKLATETNNSLQAISVLTALFLPPTLIVGIFGMNTTGLPLAGDPDGFAWVMLISALCALGAYWLLKRAPKLFRRSGLIR